VLTLGGSLLLAQAMCCILELAHAKTEEVALAHAALLMHCTAKVDSEVGGGNYGTFNEKGLIFLGGDDVWQRPRYYREAGGHAFCGAVEWQRSCIVTPLLLASMAFMGWGLSLKVCSVQFELNGHVTPLEEYSVPEMLWKVWGLTESDTDFMLGTNKYIAIFGMCTIVAVPVLRAFLFFIMWFFPLRHSRVSFLYDVNVVLSCFNGLDVFCTAMAVVRWQVDQVGKIIDPSFHIDVQVLMGLWILLGSIIVFFLTQPRGFILPRKYTEHLRTLLWEEVAGCDLNPPQYNYVRSLIRADRGEYRNAAKHLEPRKPR